MIVGKRNGQTNPPRRKPKATIETGRALPHVADGSAGLCTQALSPAQIADVGLLCHTQVGFMHQGGRLEGVIRPLAAEELPSRATQVFINRSQ